MNAVVAIVVIFLILGASLGAVAFVVYRRQLRRAKGIERGLKMVPIIIHLPPPSDDTEAGSRDLREVMREKTAQAEVLYNLIAGTAQSGFKSNFYGQRHIALELIATNGLIHFYVAVPVALVSIVEKAILTAYPGARLEEVEDHNIFNQEGRIAATMGGELMLKNDTAYPVATFKQLERDPMEAILNTLSGLQPGDGAGIQIMLRPADPAWTKRAISFAAKRAKSKHISMSFSVKDLAMAAVKSPEATDPSKQHDLTALEKNAIEAIEEKTQHTGYEVLVRVVVSTASVSRSQTLLRDLSTSFALFEAPGLNGFKFLPAVDSQGLVTAFIFRFFPPEVNSTILNSVELATLYHLPDKQFTPSTGVERQASKQVDGPTSLGSEGLLFGYNEFRGTRKEIHLSPNDRRRHTYILGQTGTGKSTMLANLAVQDMRNGGGFAFIDPHGDEAELLMSLVPKERAEDVIYFNPSDTEFPLGLNLFEFDRPEQKDFLIQETIGMLTKLYDPNGTGVIGPRFEQWYRNAALTLMSDPAGSTFIEIPKVFSDTEYLKRKFRYLKDPTVIEFWTKEMGQTSDYHKSEMLGYFVSKFGAFQQNEMMRNIIGQTESAFNIRDIMDNKKILIVNLSKGRIGELNARLLGMIFVIKIQAAAMGRADMPEIDRKDFSLYVDEFQNFSTDSFATILSEARKYRLNLIVANQFIGQLSNEIRDAVFGNVGTIIAHRMGPEDAEFMVKQFAPVFDTRDLVNIPNFHSVMRLMTGGLPSQPFSLTNLPPIGAPNLELGKAMMQLSAAKFGVPRAQVEADIFGRLSGKIGMTAANAPAAPAPAPLPAPTPVASAPAPERAPMPEPALAVLSPIMAPAPAVIPVAVPEPAPVVTKDPGHLSFQDITGPRPIATPVVATPVVSEAPAPIVEPEPEPVSELVIVEAPTPAVIPESEVVAPAPTVSVPVPAPIPDLIVAPPIGAPPVQVDEVPVQVAAPAVTPLTIEVPAVELVAPVSALDSVPLEPVTPAPVVTRLQPVATQPSESVSIHDIPLLAPEPTLVPLVTPLVAAPVPDIQDTAPAFIPTTLGAPVIEAPIVVNSAEPETPVVALVGEVVQEPIVQPIVEPNVVLEAAPIVERIPASQPEHPSRSKKKKKSGKSQADQTTPVPALMTTEAVTETAVPVEVAQAPVPTLVGRINHTRTHAQGLPIALPSAEPAPGEETDAVDSSVTEAVVTTTVITANSEPTTQETPAPEVSVDVAPEPEVQPVEEPEPLHEAEAEAQTEPATSEHEAPSSDQPSETTETGDEPVPDTVEEAQAQIEDLIDPDHHLHLFPEAQKPVVTMEALNDEPKLAEAEPTIVPVEVSSEPEVTPTSSLARADEQATAQAAAEEQEAEAAIEVAMKQAAEQLMRPTELEPMPISAPQPEPVPTPEPIIEPAPEPAAVPVVASVQDATTTSKEAKASEAVAALEQKQAEAAIDAAMSEAAAALTRPTEPEQPSIADLAKAAAPTAPEAPVKPELAPGEIFVDEDGNVHIGE